MARHQARASFFVIGIKAIKQPQLIQRLLREGHSIGDHSWNHSYREYFKPLKRTREWIARSQSELSQLIGHAPIGFRPPAGIHTPPVRQVLIEMEVPPILWSRRFFDTAFGFGDTRASKAAENIKPGDIVLLHDRSCKGIEKFLEGLKTREISLQALTA